MGFKQEHLLKKIALVYFLSKMIDSADQFWLSDPGTTPEMIKKHVFQFKENETTNYFTFHQNWYFEWVVMKKLLELQ